MHPLQFNRLTAKRGSTHRVPRPAFRISRLTTYDLRLPTSCLPPVALLIFLPTATPARIVTSDLLLAYAPGNSHRASGRPRAAIAVAIAIPRSCGPLRLRLLLRWAMARHSRLDLAHSCLARL